MLCCSLCSRAEQSDPIQAIRSNTTSSSSAPAHKLGSVNRESTTTSRLASNRPLGATIGLGLATSSAPVADGRASGRLLDADDVYNTDPNALAKNDSIKEHEADAASGRAKVRRKTTDVDELMPLGLGKDQRRRREKSEADKRNKALVFRKRGSVAAMDKYLSDEQSPATSPKEAATATPEKAVATPVTPENVCTNLSVVRGPQWMWGDEDGGAGKLGTVFGVDLKTNTALVHWTTSGDVKEHYRFADGAADLAMAEQSPTSGRDSCSGLRNFRRNSQMFYADAQQTIIVYDWDDTLFPTTYVRDDLDLNWQMPLAQQGLTRQETSVIGAKLKACERNVIDLVKKSVKIGKVVLLTLARSPWVAESCKNFYPDVGKLIADLNIPIVYAQEGHQVDYNKLQMASSENIKKYWSTVKGKAISKQLVSFYSQYEGQSWKNVISIGDSDFERLGTQAACSDYMKKFVADESRGGSRDSLKQKKQSWNPLKSLSKGKINTPELNQAEQEVDGHVIKVRTKTFKMVDEPAVEELTTQVAMLQKWIGLMVALDEGFDVNLDDLEDPTQMQRIERTLRGR